MKLSITLFTILVLNVSISGSQSLFIRLPFLCFSAKVGLMQEVVGFVGILGFGGRIWIASWFIISQHPPSKSARTSLRKTGADFILVGLSFSFVDFFDSFGGLCGILIWILNSSAVESSGVLCVSSCRYELVTS